MRRLITIIILTIVFTGCGWAWKNIPGRAAEQKPPTQAEQIESLTQTTLDFKFKLGQEMVISAQLKARNMVYAKKVTELTEALKQANAKIAQLTMKPEEGKDE